jgi:hypothetical protein
MASTPVQGPSTSAQHDAGLALQVTRALFWIHLGWLFSLPSLAVVAAHLLLADTAAYAVLFLPTLVYVSLVIQSHQLQVSLWSIVLVLLVPFQVAISTILFGVSSLVFIVEIFLLEIGALMVAAVLGTWREFPPEKGRLAGLIPIIIILTGLLVVAPAAALHPALIVGYEGAPIWIVLIAMSAFGTAVYRQSRTFFAKPVTSGMDAEVGVGVGGGSNSIGPAKNPALIGSVAMLWYVVAPWMILWVLAMFGISAPS